ncbi:MAG: signal peptidase I [Chloroflexi bacterium]|nr:signal peptidase I [Chloroflexota bacterium]
MTAFARIVRPRVAQRPRLVAASTTVLGLLFAYWWSRDFVPARIYSLWGPYFVAPLGWLAAAGVAFWALREMRRAGVATEPAEHAIEARTVLLIAGLVGAFVVALQLVVGMFAGFGYSPYAHSPRWLATNLLFAGSILLATETARVVLLRAGKGLSITLALVATTLGLAALQFGLQQFGQDGMKQQVQFWGGSFVPLAALGLLAGFFAIYGGVRAALLITAPLAAFTYFSPVLPAADWPILALAGVGGPALGLWIAESMFEEDAPAAEAAGHRFFSLPSVSWVVTAVLGLAIFWFTFGFFGYLPAFVPSESMQPAISRGDLVLTKSVDPDQVKVGDIVMYKLSAQQRVLHRVVAIRKGEDGGREFIFKGDNNNAEDLLPVRDKQLVGRFIGGVPKVGWVPLKFQTLLGGLR